MNVTMIKDILFYAFFITLIIFCVCVWLLRAKEIKSHKAEVKALEIEKRSLENKIKQLQENDYIQLFLEQKEKNEVLVKKNRWLYKKAFPGKTKSGKNHR